LKRILLCSAAFIAAPALAQTAPAPDQGAADDQSIVVTARKLDASRDSIDSSLGANAYAMDREQLDLQPGGADRSLKGVLLQAPGVTQDADGDGDVHIRNEHGNIQYRLNGITVPQGFGGFGALVDPRVASSVEVITGALPAQYGFRTAGIINMKTRTDGFDFDGDAGIYAGSNNTFQPSMTLRDTVGRLSFFVSGSYLRNDMGISNPLPDRSAIHDRTEQWRGFGYLSYVLNDNSRISAFGGTSIGDFQIPNTPGLAPSYVLNGRRAFDSALIDQTQHQVSHFGVLAWQYSNDGFDIQVAPFVRFAKAHYAPDAAGGQLMFNGADTDLTQSSLAWGAQCDASLALGDTHTLRAGLFYQRENTKTDSINRVFAVDSLGNQSSDAPIIIPVNSRESGSTLGLYLQDEWTIAEHLTFNFGLRFDQASAAVSEHQFSPRASLVWKPTSATTIHVGYARYFTPPPQELAVARTLGAFAGTTGAAPNNQADPIRSEREHNFDIGFQHFILPRLSASVDAYYKAKTNLLDEHQYGATRIANPFNYARSHSWGIEFSLNYESKLAEFYLNAARGEQKARDINSNQFFFDPAELAYIANHDIYTDHSQKWTVSGGGALKLDNPLGQFQASFDLIYGDGLRAEDPAGIVPNGGKERPYAQINLGLAQIFGMSEDEGFTLRFDVINLFDKVYLLRDGSGVGAGQPEWGPRRSFFVGLRKSF